MKCNIYIYIYNVIYICSAAVGELLESTFAVLHIGLKLILLLKVPIRAVGD